MNKSTLADKWFHFTKNTIKVSKVSRQTKSKQPRKWKESSTTILTANFIEWSETCRNIKSSKNLKFLAPKRNSDPKVRLYFCNQFATKSISVERKVKSPELPIANQTQCILLSDIHGLQIPKPIYYSSSKNFRILDTEKVNMKIESDFTVDDCCMNTLKTEKIEEMKISWENDSDISVIKRLFSPWEHLETPKILFVN